MEQYPAVYYGPQWSPGQEDILVVTDEVEALAALERGYHESPAALGYITCPSQEQAAALTAEGKMPEREPKQRGRHA